MLQQLFWDFDGTLYDSYPQVTDAMARALREFGISTDEKDLLGQLKITVYHAACLYGQLHHIDPQLILRAFQRHQDASEPFTLYAGAADCLRSLHAAGCKHYLYTHRDRRAIRQLEQDGLWPLFADAVTHEDGYADKPAPDALLALIKRHGLAPEECVMIGDRDIDILSGRNAGMRTLLFDVDHFYPELASDLRAESMREIASLIIRPKDGRNA